MKWIRIFALLAVLCTHGCSGKPSVLAGGELLVGKRNDGVFSFLGIPYAEPPLGELRWRAPQPYVPRYQPREALDFAPACMQSMRILDWYRDLAETFGGSRDYYPDLDVSEDCLYLNLWTPALDDKAALPVMVWLHGGSNTSGWSHELNYHGAELAGEGVVVVSVGYRLGLFGFMSHPDLDPSEPVANFALWDIIAALAWIRENIASFGGDPDRVTLFGESAGAHDIIALIAAEPAAGLFHRAIAQSAAGIRDPAMTMAGAQALGVGLAAAMGFEGDGTLERLRDAPADELLARYEADVSPGYHAPAIDGRLLVDDLWITLDGRRFGDVSLMIGTNADEWWNYLDGDTSREELRQFAADLPGVDIETVIEALGDERSPRHALNRLRNAYDYLCPSHALAAGMAAAGADTWVYYFTRVRDDAGGRALGAYHGAEYPYVFDTHDAYMATTAVDRDLTRSMQRYWTSFAASGNPNSETTPHWPEFAAPDFPVQELGDRVRTIAAPESPLCAALEARD